MNVSYKEIREVGKVVTGKTPPMKDDTYYVSGDRPFISPKDLSRERVYVGDTKLKVTSKALRKFKNQVIPENAILFTSLSYGFGKMGIATEDSLTNQQINTIITDPNEANPKFLFYLLKVHTPFIFSYNSGIDTPIVPKSVFERIKLPFPAVAIQSKVAAVLTGYDDLIEINNQRIQLLEKMAEEIYKEWFVRLRFLGHEKVKVVKGVPDGWKLESFSTLVNINPREKVDSKQTKPYVGMDRLSEQNMYFDAKEERKGSSGAKFRNDDVLFPRITPCLENGKRGYVFCLKPDEVALGSTEFVVFRGDKLPSEYTRGAFSRKVDCSR